ncbi:glycosyltransferase family 2 protein [Georgenia ruanii]|uniref:Glycosyltransferase n=1 Tax=Georgenia ruanii TaxID=348442 RepID=A0A7J9UTZ7_9MICO|nr:glycosyltransferase family 2 protein [Georgenia ruanii]MPV88095.1 glycosyltransferase [Georgenia ruanii]
MLTRAADAGRTGPTVSVVVCAYASERWPLLERAVRSLHGQTHPADEVVVVVDHNAELLRQARDGLPHVRVVANGAERGLSGARNTGVAHSSGAIVAFLDDDARAEPEWLARMVRHYDDPAVIGVGSLVQARWAEGRPAWYPREYEWVVGCSYRGQPTTVAEVRNPIGAGMSFRRRVFEQVGGFSTAVGRVGALPVGCEETELAIRARRRWPGAKILSDPSAVVEHLVPAHRATVRYLLARCWSEGLSKAAVARLAGPGQALAAERSYVARTLAGGVLRELSGVRGRGDVHRLARAAAMCAGLGAATGGYLRGRLTFPRPTAPSPSVPLRPLETATSRTTSPVGRPTSGEPA